MLRTVAVDPRGHGDADKPPSGYGLASLAADVVSAVDALDLPSARDLRGRPPLADEIAALTGPVDRAWARRFVAAFTDAEPVPG